MIYKGYAAKIEYREDDGCFVGHIAGIRDVVGFHGESVEELRSAFIEAVDDYLDTCASVGQSPDKPSSGKIMLRVPPEVHSKALIAAQASGKSLNAWATEVIRKAAKI